jgi:predicted RNA-binding protein YlxR (DUF448 family)
MGKGKGHIPMRTCVACGTKGPKYELVRVVLDAESQVVRDEKGKRPGRGAYVCNSESCWVKLRKGKCLKRAFRSKDVKLPGM